MSYRFASTLVFACMLALGVRCRLQANPAGASLAPAINALRASMPPAQGGTLPTQWLAGNDCQNESDFQVHAYNSDLYIIRQSKCGIFEAPFMYLIFGDETAILLDTGANPNMDVYGTVDRVMREWSQANGVSGMRLIVAHTHGHGDHIQGDAQFVGKPYVTTIVPPTQQAALQFWGFQNWPNDIQTIDLGNRVLDVLATPGHQSQSVTLYDRRTQLLLTGDIVYPGHLFVFSQAEWPQFVNSLRRMVDFAKTHPIKWVLGCHIEMSATPFVSYAWGTSVHPNERKLEFEPRKLVDIYRAAESMNNDPQCTIFDEFVIHPVYKCGITWNG